MKDPHAIVFDVERTLNTGRTSAPSDQRVVINGLTWDQYEGILDCLGDSAHVRVSYFEGELEIMSPSIRHERISSMFGRLIEMFAVEAGIELIAAGSTTFRSRMKEAGVEPDECYFLNSIREEYPDIAFEVVMSRGLRRKLDRYRALGVPEVWVWKAERLHFHLLGEGGYVPANRSRLLPSLDPELLLRFLERRDQTQATREFRDLLRAMPSP